MLVDVLKATTITYLSNDMVPAATIPHALHCIKALNMFHHIEIPSAPLACSVDSQYFIDVFTVHSVTTTKVGI